MAVDPCLPFYLHFYFLSRAPHWNILMLTPSPGLGHPDSHNLQLKSAFLSQLPRLRYSSTATETATNAVIMWLMPVIPMSSCSEFPQTLAPFWEAIGPLGRRAWWAELCGAYSEHLASPSVLSDKNCPVTIQYYRSLVQCMRPSDFGLKPLKPWAKKTPLLLQTKMP